METRPKDMATLSSVLEKLRKNRQDNEFIMTDEGFSPGNSKYYKPEELSIIKTYRFEGDSNPSDSSVLYVIEANDGLKGYTIDSYGAETNHHENYDDFIRQIPVNERKD